MRWLQAIFVFVCTSLCSSAERNSIHGGKWGICPEGRRFSWSHVDKEVSVHTRRGREEGGRRGIRLIKGGGGGRGKGYSERTIRSPTQPNQTERMRVRAEVYSYPPAPARLRHLPPPQGLLYRPHGRQTFLDVAVAVLTSVLHAAETKLKKSAAKSSHHSEINLAPLSTHTERQRFLRYCSRKPMGESK